MDLFNKFILLFSFLNRRAFVIKFEPIKKPKKIVIQAYVLPDLAEAIKKIGKGSMSGGLKIILTTIRGDIDNAAKNATKKAS